MNLKSGIDNALLRAADPLLQSFMKLDDCGGFFKQADMKQGLLFAIRARGFEERWRAQGHDISEMSDPLLQSFMKLDDCGGFFKQADMKQGLLFAIRARGFEERWRAQGHDISEMSYKIRVMLSHLRQEKGSRPRPTLARNR